MKNDLGCNCELKAKDIMNTDVAYVTAGVRVCELADFLQANGVTGVPVVNSKGKVVGVVSESDIVAVNTFRESQGEEVPTYYNLGAWSGARKVVEPYGEGKVEGILERTVEDIMTPWIVSVEEEASVVKIAQRMITDRVHRVLVMDSKNHLKGIVSAMDIVRFVAERTSD